MKDTVRTKRPFPETNWGLIEECQHSVTDPQTRQRLDDLIEKYWSPVFYHVHRYWTKDVEEAKDLTQSFFAAFLEKNFLDSVQADRGRFRTFVLAALKHYLLANKRAKRAKKRHPETGLISLDSIRAEQGGFDIAGKEGDCPEERFTQDWRRAMIEGAIVQLRKTAERKDKPYLAEVFVRYDLERSGQGSLTYQDLAQEFNISPAQVTNGLRWARQEFMNLLQAELRRQVGSEEDYADEAQMLFGIEVNA